MRSLVVLTPPSGGIPSRLSASSRTRDPARRAQSTANALLPVKPKPDGSGLRYSRRTREALSASDGFRRRTPDNLDGDWRIAAHAWVWIRAVQLDVDEIPLCIGDAVDCGRLSNQIDQLIPRPAGSSTASQVDLRVDLIEAVPKGCGRAGLHCRAGLVVAGVRRGGVTWVRAFGRSQGCRSSATEGP